MFRILNARRSSWPCPGHEFYVVALDGNPVPRPNKVKVLSSDLPNALSAIRGDEESGHLDSRYSMDEDRNRGMGIVVEYAGRKGKPPVFHQ